MKKMLLAFLTFLSFSLSALAGVNINTATQAELESLDGIGPAKAQAIIDYRKKNGSFKTVDELEKVNGIGAVTLKNLRKDVSIDGKTTVVTPKESKPAKKMEADKKAKDTKSVGKEKAAVSGKTADIKEAKPAKVKDTAKADKKTKDTKSVGTEKAAASGKTADTKEVKPVKVEDTAKATKADKKGTKAKAQ